MTCIVAYANDECMVMGGDSAGVSGYSYVIRDDPKVFKISQIKGPEAIIGFTSSFRMGQALMSLTLPEDKSRYNDKAEHFKFIRTKFVAAIRKLFKDEGYSKISNNVESGGNFLIAYRGRIYEIGSDFQVCVPSLPYIAIGAGEDFAMGALDYVHEYHKSSPPHPEVMVMRALEVSARHCSAVFGPMRVIKLPSNP